MPVARPDNGPSRWILVIRCCRRISISICRAVCARGRTKPEPRAGVVGSFHALNARPEHLLGEWLDRITTELAEYNAKHPDAPAAPFAVNQIVHKSNDRLEHDLGVCAQYKVPIVITSLGAREEVNQIASNGAAEDEPLDGEPIPSMDEALGAESGETGQDTEKGEGEAASA